MELREILTRERMIRGIEYGIVGVAVCVILLGYLNLETATKTVNNSYHKILLTDYACFLKAQLTCYEQAGHQFCRLPGNAVADMGMVGLNFTGLR